jgi:hypothetical protein
MNEMFNTRKIMRCVTENNSTHLCQEECLCFELNEFVSLLGSPVELDSENNISSEVPSTYSVSQLELPTPERLLPIGSHSKESVPCLVEKVRQALGMPAVAECETLQGKNRSNC